MSQVVIVFACVCIIVFVYNLSFCVYLYSYFRRVHVFSSVSGSAAGPPLTSAATQPLKDSDIDDDHDDDEDDDDDDDDKDAIQWHSLILKYDNDFNS